MDAADGLRMPLYVQQLTNYDGPYGGQPGHMTPSLRANADFWTRMSLGEMIFGGVFGRHTN